MKVKMLLLCLPKGTGSCYDLIRKKAVNNWWAKAVIHNELACTVFTFLGSKHSNTPETICTNQTVVKNC